MFYRLTFNQSSTYMTTHINSDLEQENAQLKDIIRLLETQLATFYSQLEQDSSKELHTEYQSQLNQIDEE